MLKITLAVLLYTSFAAAAPPTDYCQRSADLSFFKAQASVPENHLGVRNSGGLFDGGVCWWHSLFQRAALYLTVFNPTQPKPSKDKIEAIVHAIASGKQVVEIPGYSNILEFSLENWPVIQAKLEEWQLVDGFLKQAWINSVTSTYDEDPKVLKKTMDSLYTDVETNKEITWVMLKFKGFGAHAWLVVDMTIVPSGPSGSTAVPAGYEFVVIDSNYPTQMVNVAYVNGSQSIGSSLGPLALFPGRKEFFKDFKKAREKYCATGSTGTVLNPEGTSHHVNLEKVPLSNGIE